MGLSYLVHYYQHYSFVYHWQLVIYLLGHGFLLCYPYCEELSRKVLDCIVFMNIILCARFLLTQQMFILCCKVISLHSKFRKFYYKILFSIWRNRLPISSIATLGYWYIVRIAEKVWNFKMSFLSQVVSLDCVLVQYY